MPIVHETDLPGCRLIVPDRHGDHRGFFAEIWNRRIFDRIGIEIDFVQDNHSVSAQAGTLRGLHAQAPPHAQAKVVRCGRGRLLDVAVDVRVGSPTYGRHVAVELTASNGRQLLVPIGFLHGFVTLEPDTEIIYKCSDYYVPQAELCVHWKSPTLDLSWAGVVDPVVSPRDAQAEDFAAFRSPFRWEGLR